MTTLADVVKVFCDDHSDETLGPRRDAGYGISKTTSAPSTPRPKS